MRFKLIDVVDTPLTISYMEKRGSSRVYTHKTFQPGKVYELDTDDELARDTLLKAESTIVGKKSMIEAFDEAGIEYRLKKPTCACQKKPVIVFHPVVEVTE